jgi:ribosomal protein S14
MSRKLASTVDFNHRIKKDHIQFIDQHKKALQSDIKVPTNCKNKLICTNKNKYHNYCLITGRTKGIYNEYKMGRMSLKYAIYHGYVNGITKYSW